MKRLEIPWKIALLLIIISSSLPSCDDDDQTIQNAGISGEWRLIETLADPGDGSGQYMPVQSDKRISIFTDGSFSSNGDPCDFQIAADNPSEGSYNQNDQGYYIDCGLPLEASILLSLEDDYLIIQFFCFEPCLHKYERLN
jgi:hypothetical protein